MRLLALIIILLSTLAGDCEDDCPASEVVSETEAEAQVQSLCSSESTFCQSVQSTKLAWSDGVAVYFSPVRCAEDLAICRFSIWHEIDHVRFGASETLADCFAAESADADDVDATICYFDTTTFIGETNATHGSGPERADRIRSCR